MLALVLSVPAWLGLESIDPPGGEATKDEHFTCVSGQRRKV